MKVCVCVCGGGYPGLTVVYENTRGKPSLGSKHPVRTAEFIDLRRIICLRKSEYLTFQN